MTDRPTIEQQLASVIGDVWVVFVAGDGENAIRAKTPDELAAAILTAVNDGTIDPIVPEGYGILTPAAVTELIRMIGHREVVGLALREDKT